MLNIKTFSVNPLQENTYVISDETHECVIIDCGAFTPDERSEISDYIDTEGLKPVALLATHGHLDHNLGIGYIFEKYQLKVTLHRGDERLLREMKIQGESMFGIIVDFTPQIETLVNDGDEIHFGSHTLRCYSRAYHGRVVVLLCRGEGPVFRRHIIPSVYRTYRSPWRLDVHDYQLAASALPAS